MRSLAIYLHIFIFVLIAIPHNAHASQWVEYRDEDGIFNLLIPENYKINKKSFRVTDQEVVVSTELTANIDQRPFKNSVKQFIVRADHTFAFPATDEEIPVILESEANKYIDYYKSLGGEVASKRIQVYAGHPGVEIILAYQDPKFGPQTVQARIIIADFTRFEQIAIGPMEAGFAEETKKFFTSLKLNSGRTKLPGTFEEEWRKIRSPFHLSTVMIPGISPPFVTDDPQFQSNDKVERLTLKIKDPLFNSTMFYSVYGYRFNTMMTAEKVQEILLDRHLKKFKVDIRTVKFGRTNYGKMPVITTTVRFPRPKKYPYMDTIKLVAYYFGNFVTVQELAGSSPHITSPYAKKLLSMFEFHPVSANAKFETEKKEAVLNSMPAAPAEQDVPEADTAATPAETEQAPLPQN